MNVMKRLVPVGLAAGALAAAAAPVKVIFDTDMITDFDDVGALACLHALADAGEWAPDENGPHVRITERLPKAEVGRIIDELMMRGPKLAASQGARAGKQERARP